MWWQKCIFAARKVSISRSAIGTGFTQAKDMKHSFFSLILLSALTLCATSCNGQNDSNEPEVLLQTTAGDIRIRLYNDTPLHRDNFLRNVRDGKYDGVSFHRVIRNFMIQTGDPDTRPGIARQQSSEKGDSAAGETTVEAEILFPTHYHKRGVVAAARQGDDVNPTKASSAYQFYIVTGKFQSEMTLASLEVSRRDARVAQIYNQKIKANQAQLDALRKARERDAVSNLLTELRDQAQAEVDRLPRSTFEYTTEQQRTYRSAGGAPWLDGEYTVFGEVVEGMKVVLDIEKVKTDDTDKPVTDIRITKATVL